MQSFRRRGTFSRSLLSDQLSVNDLSVLGLSTWKRIKLPIEKYHVSTPSYRSSIDLFCVERLREKKRKSREITFITIIVLLKTSRIYYFPFLSRHGFFPRTMSTKYRIPPVETFLRCASPFFLPFVSLQLRRKLRSFLRVDLIRRFRAIGTRRSENARKKERKKEKEKRKEIAS